MIPMTDPLNGTTNDDHYNTPKRLWLPGLTVTSQSCYTLDVATNPYSSVPARKKFTIKDDALSQEWKVSGVNKVTLWMNPPFSKNAQFCDKLIEEREKRNIEAFVLVKHDHRVSWFNKYLTTANGICMVAGYVKFEPEKHPYRLPVSVFYYGTRYHSFESEFSKLGVTLSLSCTKSTIRNGQILETIKSASD